MSHHQIGACRSIEEFEDPTRKALVGVMHRETSGRLQALRDEGVMKGVHAFGKLPALPVALQKPFALHEVRRTCYQNRLQRERNLIGQGATESSHAFVPYGSTRHITALRQLDDERHDAALWEAQFILLLSSCEQNILPSKINRLQMCHNEILFFFRQVR